MYLLAHDSEEAAKKSFAAFRSDPDWLAVKQASEEMSGELAHQGCENGVHRNSPELVLDRVKSLMAVAAQVEFAGAFCVVEAARVRRRPLDTG